MFATSTSLGLLLAPAPLYASTAAPVAAAATTSVADSAALTAATATVGDGANEVQQLPVRQLAGVVLKNCVTANGAEASAQKAATWLAVGPPERTQIKPPHVAQHAPSGRRQKHMGSATSDHQRRRV